MRHTADRELVCLAKSKAPHPAPKVLCFYAVKYSTACGCVKDKTLPLPPAQQPSNNSQSSENNQKTHKQCQRESWASSGRAERPEGQGEDDHRDQPTTELAEDRGESPAVAPKSRHEYRSSFVAHVRCSRHIHSDHLTVIVDYDPEAQHAEPLPHLGRKRLAKHLIHIDILQRRVHRCLRE